MGKHGKALCDNFRRYFSIHLALSEKQIQQVYRIRYDVYCAELGFEPVDKFPNKTEHDQFDNRSLHALITHKSSQKPAGCVRIIQTEDSMDAQPLPLEKYCYKNLHIEAAEILGNERHSVCEVSRLAVAPFFRRRFGETRSQLGGWGAVDICENEKRTFSLIAEAGFIASTAMAKLTGRDHMFAMMEPMLPRLLWRSGIHYHPVGEEVNYRGLRKPYMATVGSFEQHLRSNLRELYHYIYHQFDLDLSANKKSACF